MKNIVNFTSLFSFCVLVETEILVSTSSNSINVLVESRLDTSFESLGQKTSKNVCIITSVNRRLLTALRKLSVTLEAAY